MKRDFVSLKDLSGDEVLELIDLTEKLKQNKTGSHDLLGGRTFGLLFQKPSNRTRVSFHVGINQLGGHCIYLGPDEINLGVRESTADVSKTLSRYLDGIVARVYSHDDVVDMAKYSSISVINGLSDLYHPCQGLTDIFSIKEKLSTLENVTVAYVGDGNNVCHSLMMACAKTGVNINVATPEGYEPNEDVVKIVADIAKETKAKIMLTNEATKAVKDVNVIYSDVWTSMGQEEEAKQRLKDFQEFQINKDLVKAADKDYIFMHCLPAHRGEEVTAEIIDGEHSIVFDQAENRLHTQKAILIYIYERRSRSRA